MVFGFNFLIFNYIMLTQSVSLDNIINIFSIKLVDFYKLFGQIQIFFNVGMIMVYFFKIQLNLFDSFIKTGYNFLQISANICELSNYLPVIFLIIIKFENFIIFKIIKDQK